MLIDRKFAALKNAPAAEKPALARAFLWLVERFLRRVGWGGVFISVIMLGFGWAKGGDTGATIILFILFFISLVPLSIAKKLEKVRKGLGQPLAAQPEPVLPVHVPAAAAAGYDPNSALFKQRPIVQRMRKHPYEFGRNRAKKTPEWRAFFSSQASFRPPSAVRRFLPSGWRKR